jgi:hypothetical protein
MHIVFVGKSERKSQLERTKHRQEDEFNWVLQKKDSRVWTEIMFTRKRTSSGSLSDNIRSVSLQDGEYAAYCFVITVIRLCVFY